MSVREIRDWTDLQAHWAASVAREPDYRTEEEKALLQRMNQAREELKRLGWRDAIYCPKDGSRFLAIEPGSRGVFPCYYEGEWPSGRWWIVSAGDVWPARPTLWKPLPSTEHAR